MNKEVDSGICGTQTGTEIEVCVILFPVIVVGLPLLLSALAITVIEVRTRRSESTTSTHEPFESSGSSDGDEPASKAVSGNENSYWQSV